MNTKLLKIFLKFSTLLKICKINSIFAHVDETWHKLGVS